MPELHGGFREEELVMRVGLNRLVAMMFATITSPVIAQTTVAGAGSTDTEAVLATVTRAK